MTTYLITFKEDGESKQTVYEGDYALEDAESAAACLVANETNFIFQVLRW